MAKYIKMTPELQAECRAAFIAQLDHVLTTNKFSDGKLSFSKSFGSVSRKASVYLTEEAWIKITALLREFNKEVAWHATAYRIPGDKDEYLIKDILVYPQTVTAATVEMDEEKYAQWLIDNIDDERFDNIRCQMHSHVNMGVFASGTDIQHQEEILEQLGDEDFYIFMIWNKSLSVYIRIFDMQKNIVFETADCSWAVLDNAIGLNKFIADAKKIVEERASAVYAGGQHWSGKSYYGGQNYGGPYNPVGQTGYGSSNNKSKDKTDKPKDKSDKKKDKKKTKFTDERGSHTVGQMRIITFGGDELDPADPFCAHDGPFQIT